MPDETEPAEMDEQDRAEMFDEDAMDGDDLADAGRFPPDKLSALTQIGPLIDERIAGEPIAERVRREEPEAGSVPRQEQPRDRASDVGRLTEAPDDDLTDGVGESDLLAESHDDEVDLAAEEAAVHVIDRA